MAVAPRSLIAAAALLAAPAAVAAQDSTPPPTHGHFHIGLTVHDYGVTIGNAPRTNGVRLNFQDARNNKPPFRWLPILNVHL